MQIVGVLILGLRCFGDKGDVEDITEGKAGSLLSMGYLVLDDAASSSSRCAFLANITSPSGYHFHRRVRSHGQLSRDG